MKVVVLAGGTSTERDVSLSSGSMIYRALKKNGHQAILLDVYLGYEGNVDGIFERDEDWAAQVGAISEKNPDLDVIRAMRPDGDKNFFGPNVLSLCKSADAVFMALHGANGEDGKIQACFELMGITYTGTDFVSSAIAMDKGITKDIFRAYGIPTPAGLRLKKGEREREKVPYPCIVKACCGGSSVGVSIARNEGEYENAKEEAFLYDNEVIVEQYIEGREFSVGVMDGKALPVIEIAPKQGFYDYKNKYQAGSTVETCPARLSREETEKIQRLAELAYEALRMKSYARMDFMKNDQGEFFCLEANTLPGMTPTSLLPQEAAAVGMSFEELCEKILQYAVTDK
ncbi:MAG TPA: D-alanine--D-alanine ligase [Candidatus Acetatifactor stercoripullorum]|uniref:D-alanine--D-alanine ligase n=1 Tax=Candidatus Acetatifactor stercoripullorum TaxID=2838414 RepID=A0A9D1R4G0_9FIRM|nr:D-alanine--D-alanine ligase [Candidatus Acetatifactor stercoripullorum]HIW80675.1 D-alanine--D-alanine ligase [Candidatus Acetatifactor stercoripullorum]